MLEAQRARSYSTGQCDESLWGRDKAMLSACARSTKAYQEIKELTDYYNNEMANGNGNIPCVSTRGICMYSIRLLFL